MNEPQRSDSATAQTVHWEEDGTQRSALWRSQAGAAVPRRVLPGDDTLPADQAWRLACEGTAILWRGDFNNGRLLLQAIARRIARKPSPPARPGKAGKAPITPAQSFHLYRQAQAQRARTLGMLLVPLDASYKVALRRAPDVAQACSAAYGPAEAPSLVSLRELQGLIGAHEWRKKGVEIAALGARIHPHYGVFSPVRSEYVDLVAAAPLPDTTLAFDIGTGTGVLAAVLARRGIARVVASDVDPRALACARDNLERLGVAQRVELVRADLFPQGCAPLIVCNPPWLPARPSSPLEAAIYDPASRMLRGFLSGLAEHLEPRGEGWLILSDLAEHLGLRTRDELLAWIAQGGLNVVARHDIRPRHPKAGDPDDPLHLARSAERTSLWRLTAQ